MSDADPNRRWLRVIVVTVVAAASTLLGMFFGFWLSLVVLLNLPDSSPALPDWVWVIPYALSLVVGLIGLSVSRTLMRRLIKK